MALHFVLHVNSRPIGACSITRVEPDTGTPPPDTVCVYEVDVQDERPPRSRYTSRVQHRYGDGPWGLLRAALGHVADLQAGGSGR